MKVPEKTIIFRCLKYVHMSSQLHQSWGEKENKPPHGFITATVEKPFRAFHHDGKEIQRRIRSAILWSDLLLPLKSIQKAIVGAECVFFISRPSLEELLELFPE